MSETNRQVVRRLIDEVQAKADYAVFDELMHPDFVDHTPPPGVMPTRDGVREFYRQFHQGFSDLRVDVEFQVAEDDLVTSRKVYTAVHRGEFAGIPATGREVQFDVIDVLRVRDGRITDHWGVMNMLALMHQLSGQPV